MIELCCIFSNLRMRPLSLHLMRWMYATDSPALNTYIESWFYTPDQVSKTVSCIVISLPSRRTSQETRKRMFTPLLVSLWPLISVVIPPPPPQEIHTEIFTSFLEFRRHHCIPLMSNLSIIFHREFLFHYKLYLLLAVGNNINVAIHLVLHWLITGTQNVIE
jgi:hypothetical protein